MIENLGNNPSILTPVLTIMPDYGGTFLWLKEEEEGTYVGQCLTSHHCGYTNDLPLSQSLWQAFIGWQSEFDKTAFDYDTNNQAWTNFRYDVRKYWDWNAFHTQGFILAKRLKCEVGKNFRVLYHKCGEDFNACRKTVYEILATEEIITLRWDDEKNRYQPNSPSNQPLKNASENPPSC